MYIHGSFLSQRGETVTVHIVTKQDRTTEMEIGGSDDADLFFTDDPCEITSEVNDTFDVLLRSSASIRLLARNFVEDFFCTSCRDAVVNIYKGDACVFAGYIEPQSYSQSYNELYDEIELNCIDALSALQYSKYKDVGASGVLYDVVKSEATQRTFREIMTEILGNVTSDLDIVGGSSIRYLYDGSKGVNNSGGSNYTVFQNISISDLLFLGDEEDDVCQQDEVLEALLKYLNLHIAQDGFNFYIFDWATVKSADAIKWADLNNGGATSTTERCAIAVTVGNVADTDTQISIGEVYNQLLLTCKIEDVENVIESPLDDDLLTSPFDSKQLYCTEFSADGEGKSAYNAFYAMCHDESTNYGSGAITNWYVRVMQNALWKFPWTGGFDLIEYFGSQGINQQALPNYLSGAPGAALLAFGSVQTNTAKDDNSPTSKVSMTNYLVVSVNGNEVDNDETNTYPGVSDIEARIPYAEYTGNSARGVFSPSDDNTTNYIVFSGKIVLNPIMHMTGDYKDLHNSTDWKNYIIGVAEIGGTVFPSFSAIWHKTVPSRNNGDGRYYTRKYWKAEKPTDTPTWDEYSSADGLAPYTGEGPQEYEFKYSAIGDSTDQISKIAVLACMLVIGDKCVVETGTDGQPSDFTWQTYKTLAQCADEDEYYQQCFTIGFDPKIGDKLIGTEFDLQNNISYTMGIDAEGIAIPIKKDDNVNGQIMFKILGPVNTTWDVITRRHKTWFRHTKWSSSTVPLLAHISSIFIKEFECKVYSDNGQVNTGQDDNDVIYMSDTAEKFVNKKDDLEFKVCSALTSDECKELGVSNGVKLSTPLNTLTDSGVLTIYDSIQKVTAKAEQLYVDSYYNEYHAPRVIMEQNLVDDGGIGLFNHYTHPAIGKSFYVQGIGRNLIDGSAKLTLKEIEA